MSHEHLLRSEIPWLTSLCESGYYPATPEIEGGQFRRRSYQSECGRWLRDGERSEARSPKRFMSCNRNIVNEGLA